MYYPKDFLIAGGIHWPTIVCEYTYGPQGFSIVRYIDIWGNPWDAGQLDPDIRAELDDHAMEQIRNPTCENSGCDNYVADAGDWCDACNGLSTRAAGEAWVL